MYILDLPSFLQPNYVCNYPPYSSGKNTEEICYELLKTRVNTTEHVENTPIYLPVFWTSIYTMRTTEGNFDDIYEWLETLDSTKRYFTIVQNDCGIYVKDIEKYKNITVFSAGGGGLNIKDGNIRKELEYYGVTRFVFTGNNGDYHIPLMCLPLLQETPNYTRDIYCSFAGRYDTHWCRFKMAEQLLKHNYSNDNNLFHFFESTTDINIYKDILNRSVFTLAPRGYGYTSFRLFEAILCGSIPIYIWEDKKILPDYDILDWRKFAIIIHIDDIEHLPKILQGVDIEKMQKNLQVVKKYFTYEYIIEYIQSKIKEL